MGTHAEWTENLVAEINSLHQSRADSLAAIRTETAELLAQFQKEHGEMAKELHESLGEFGADVRAAADMWVGRSKHSTRERSRPEEPGERQAKGAKKKGKQG